MNNFMKKEGRVAHQISVTWNEPFISPLNPLLTPAMVNIFIEIYKIFAFFIPH